MLTKVKELVIRKKITSLLKKYHVELKHYTPGRVRVKLANWRNKRETLQNLIKDLELDADVESIEFTEQTGSILIYFNENALMNPQTHNRWIHIFEKYNL